MGSLSSGCRRRESHLSLPALTVGPQAVCMVMLDPLLAEQHSETSKQQELLVLRHLES